MTEQLSPTSGVDPTLLGVQPANQAELLSQTYSIETASGPISVTSLQESTRGDGSVELSDETFDRSNIDFSGVQEHLAIHQDGEIAGSQFNGALFPDSQTVVSFLSEVLPSTLQYDQHGRVEMTLEVQLPNHESLGYSGVKSIAELEADGAHIESSIRTPGGEPAEEDGIKGAWYPEMVRDPETGSFVVKKTESGEVANPHGKFEPEANVATVFGAKAAETNKVSVVMQRNTETGQPMVLTAYPGEIAPAYPTRITTEAFSADSLHGKEAEYWSQHAFIKFAA